MAKTLDLTIAPDEFCIDGIPTKVTERVFDGNYHPLPKILFRDPETRGRSYERSALIKMFGFNGTAVLTPSAVNRRSNLYIQDIQPSSLEGQLLVLDLLPGVGYGVKEMTDLLITNSILGRNDRRVDDKKYIILFRTGLMDNVLQTVKANGVPDYHQLDSTQENRAGILPDGAVLLTQLHIASAYMIDNISFETNEGSKNGFAATQILMNPNQRKRTFAPLIYHVVKTLSKEFDEIARDYAHAQITLGNIPRNSPLQGYPVAVKIYKD